MENNYFVIKKYISKHSAKKKDVLVIFKLSKEMKNSNLFDKKRQIKQEES